MHAKHFLQRLFRHPLASLLGGLALGGVGIGIALLIIVFWIEPMSKPELAGTVSYREGRFTLWYQEDAAGRENHDLLAEVLTRDYEELIDLLDVNPDLIPTPIDVFVHDDVASMQASIVKRKSPEARATYPAPLDLLASENPRGRLAELILTFGWGPCGSQVLKTGVTVYATEPERNFHAVVAALPERLFLTLPELIRMEERGLFPPSVYQQFDSPYSPAMISFAELKSLFELSVRGEAEPADIPTLEAASLVQFLIETNGGIREVKRAWGKGSTEKLLQRVDSRSMAEISAAWYGVESEEGRAAPDFPYLRAYYLLAGGLPDAAWAEARTWAVDTLSDEEILLAGRCALSVGEFSAAADLATHLKGHEATDELEGYLALYQGWSVEVSPGLRIFSPPGGGGESITQVAEVYARMAARLDLSADDLPERLTIFLYPDESSRDRGTALTPLAAAQSGTLHLLYNDDLAYRLGEVLPVYAWRKDSYSRLLRTGLAVALSRSEERLVSEGCQLRSEERWFPLYRLDFGMADQRTVEVEAGLLAQYLLTTYGARELAQIWIATSPLDRYLSVDKALDEVCKTTRREIEESLFSSLLSCDG
jgi:hypothetical protein